MDRMLSVRCLSSIDVFLPGKCRQMFSSKRRIRYGGKREERQKQKMLCFFKQKQRIHLNRLREALQKEKEATKVTEEDLSSEHFVHLLRLKEERQQKSKNQPLFREGSPLFQIFGDTSTQSFDNLPFMQFEGKIDVIHCEKEESSHSSYLNNIRVVGVDTEAKPRIKPGKNNPVCLVQLATLDKAFIYRLKKGQILPPILKDIFANPEILKVGHALDDDFRQLKNSRLVESVASTIDTLPIARKLGCLRPGLKTLCQAFLGHNICKQMQVSNWEAEELSQEQLTYAATDAWAPLEVLLEMVKVEESKPFLNTKSFTSGSHNLGKKNHEHVMDLLETLLGHRTALVSMDRS